MSRFSLPIFSLVLMMTICPAADQPNVVIFLTDDQGWGDLSINGNQNLETPHIDSIGKQGAVLENFYVCAVCAPTRAEFLTGRYHPKTGVSSVSRGEERLNPDETTIADVFKQHGYQTGAFGKWHNGTQAPFHPNDRGFDEYYGFTSGHWGAYYSPPLDHNKRKVKGEGYLVDDLTNHAIRFIESNKDRAFFCYIPYNTPHSPMIIGDKWYSKFADSDPVMKFNAPNKEDITMTRAALAMVENIDWNVGRVLTILKKLQLEDDTIVVFFSDNGPNSFRWNGGMKGKKGTIDEGGLRSPFLIRWPGKIASGKSIDTVNAAIDLLPTLTDLAGLKLKTQKPIDGRSFANSLVEGTDVKPKQRNLFSVWKNRVSVRTERFRMDQTGRLYDIKSDRGQKIDVADQHPTIAAELKGAITSFKQEMQAHFQANANRPFTVGYDPATTLPARDGIEQGSTITRSAKAPNNSFFENWKSADDQITFSVDVVNPDEYEAIVYYTCRAEDVGATIRITEVGGASTEAKITKAFDPPFYDNSKERMANSHYIVKDFAPAQLGKIKLRKGKQVLQLTASKFAGEEAIDFHSLELRRP